MKSNRGNIGLNLPSDGERRERDAYYTPTWAIDVLLDSGILDLKGKQILEPCAGGGAIVDALKSRGFNVMGRDINGDERWEQRNFLDGMEGYDAIITNPPFKLMDKFLFSAVQSAKQVAVIGRTLIVEGNRRRKLWKSNPPSHILQLPHRVDFSGKGDGKGGVMVMAWFIWDGSNNKETKFVW